MAQILQQKRVSTYRTLDDQELVFAGAIQGTNSEHTAQRHLFTPRHLQSPQYRHGQDHNHNVLETVQDGDVHIKRPLISARAVNHIWRPSVRYRPTDEAVRDDCARPKGNIHRQHSVASDEEPARGKEMDVEGNDRCTDRRHSGYPEYWGQEQKLFSTCQLGSRRNKEASPEGLIFQGRCPPSAGLCNSILVIVIKSAQSQDILLWLRRVTINTDASLSECKDLETWVMSG